MRVRAAILLCAACGALASAPAAAGPSLPADHPTYRAARAVFDDLVRAIGDGRTPPELEVVPRGAASRLQVAWYDPFRRVVAVDEATCEVCAAFGPRAADALAVVLGHELAHCYRDHGWVGDFGNGFADLEVGRTLRELDETEPRLVELEAEADYFGGFHACVAGYDGLGVAPQVLERIYAAHGLSGELPGYPALAERQAIARAAEARLRHLLPVFRAGNALLLVRYYDTAARCFDALAAEFPSREILCNAGVARLLAALALFGAGRATLAYPAELDARTRLEQAVRIGRSAVTAGDSLLRRQLLERAQACFEQARQRDPGYAPAYVDLACVADLRDQPGDALFWAQKARGVAAAAGDTVTAAHALVARGIAELHQIPPDGAAARRDFEAAAAAGDPLGRLDLAILDDPGAAAAPGPADRAGKPAAPREPLAGPGSEEWAALSAAPDDTVSLPALGPERPAVAIAARRFEAWDALLVDVGGTLVTFMSARPGCAAPTARGVRLGDAGARVDSTYGRPSALVAGSAGSHRIYEHDGIIFHSDGRDRVQGWTVYGIDEPFR